MEISLGIGNRVDKPEVRVSDGHILGSDDQGGEKEWVKEAM